MNSTSTKQPTNLQSEYKSASSIPLAHQHTNHFFSSVKSICLQLAHSNPYPPPSSSYKQPPTPTTLLHPPKPSVGRHSTKPQPRRRRIYTFYPPPHPSKTFVACFTFSPQDADLRENPNGEDDDPRG